MTIISLFYCCKKVFILTNTWLILEKLNEASLPEIEDFYIHLNVEDITDADYVHAKRLSKKFKNKNLGEDHELQLHNDTLLSAGLYKKYMF